jgi:hypothetical protein
MSSCAVKVVSVEGVGEQGTEHIFGLQREDVTGG